MALERTAFSLNLLVLGLLGAAPAAAQIISPPRVHWIGPEAECDYPSIQDALADVFNCGIFACPPGRNELRLSNNYSHSGQVVVDKTFDIRGGFVACEGASFGVSTNLDAPDGQALFVIQPGGATIDNVFRFVSLTGSVLTADRGGVIRMDSGDASLTLRDSLVRNGKAATGGGVYMAGNGNRLILQDTGVINNTATEGAGIFCTNGGTIDFKSGRIDDNTAELSGGGLYLQANCTLLGQTAREDRQIIGNSVTDSQRGQGAGIFALFSTIQMGALLSRTRIEENIIQTVPLHEYSSAGDNRGGGVHLESSDAVLYNSWFRGNEAADGGGISVVGASDLLVDRYSGPCHSSDVGSSPDCSLFEFNRARGGVAGPGAIHPDDDEGGDGAAVYGDIALGSFPTVRINRSTLRFNFASCFEIFAPDLTGECDLSGVGGVRGYSDTSIVRGRFNSTEPFELSGNLLYGNDIGDDDDCLFGACTKSGQILSEVTRLEGNTVANNGDSDYLLVNSSPIKATLLNNIIRDTAPDRFASAGDVTVASCNISNFADEMNLEATESVPIINVDLDPLFINPDLGTSPNEDFRVQAPDSPAVDRCDESAATGLTYDILGNPRTLNIPGVGNGPGTRDAGAFETMPEGFVNSTTDLRVDVQSSTPKRADLSEGHVFTISITNTGLNSPADAAVELDFDDVDGTLEDLRGASVFDANGNPLQVWDCDAATARCQVLADLPTGSTTAPIIAELSYASAGSKQVTATALMEDAALTELNASDNVGSDTVTVGPGADLSVDLISAAPREVGLNDPQLLIFHVDNGGPETATGVRVDLTAPGAQVSFLGGNDWICDNLALSCLRGADLEPDQPFPSSFTAEVRYAAPGTKTLTAQVAAQGGPGDPEPDNNTDADFVDVTGPVSENLFADGFED